ncbi:MAG: four helix bundle protein [Armatimonadetes bacterium]|nr:four helix bundle protein [Armatimonadota bacterium]
MGGELKDVKELTAWRCAVQLCWAVYLASRKLPPTERFGLTAQMRRAAVSIPSNLAEGYGRGTRKDYRQFVWIARGSACELETQIIIARELCFLDEPTSAALTEEVQRVLQLLSGLARSLSS